VCSSLKALTLDKGSLNAPLSANGLAPSLGKSRSAADRCSLFARRG
jgi:hypothetical protein